jgi:hypothetical protein
MSEPWEEDVEFLEGWCFHPTADRRIKGVIKELRDTKAELELYKSPPAHRLKCNFYRYGHGYRIDVPPQSLLVETHVKGLAYIMKCHLQEREPTT